MRLIAFWSVDSDFDRDAFECMSVVDAVSILYHKRDEIGTKFYDLDARSYNDSLWQDGIRSLSDFEDDYNYEDLDGGFWCKVFELDEEYVKEIINE